MVALERYYRAIWVLDFEFHQPPGERPRPLCLVARELRSGRRVAHWLEETVPPSLPWSTTPDTLVVTYYGSAELSCHLALGWPFPTRQIDLFVEFKNLTSGLSVPCGYSLLGALEAYGLQGMAATTKDDMRELAKRGGPYTAAEREALLTYCQSDVEALARLLMAMLPELDLPRALLRGRYLSAVAHMEWTGVPLDTEMLTELRAQWAPIRRQLAREVNRTCGVFVPEGQAPLDPQTAFGAAVLRLAAIHGVDPYQLAWAADAVWREQQDLYLETRAAIKKARFRTGLTSAAITRWETAGHDASSWPGLDDLASELAATLPALGIGPGAYSGGADATDYAGRLWTLLRNAEDRVPQRYDHAILQRAVALVTDDPEGLAWEGALTFSSQRFAQYVTHHAIPWPRLASGTLALDDDTFKEMARAYPVEIGPIREVRHTLSQLKLQDLAVGQDGRNRCLLSVFAARTGRNQPSTSAYIFGPSTWLRGLIKPGPGRAVAYVDWSQQELAIAAYLSNDQRMMDAYQSGDFYLTFAQMAGAAPPEATRATHDGVREQFKILSLGVLYGLTEHGIARRLSVPLCAGRLLLQQHKEVFRDFWRWSDLVEMQGMLGGTLQTVFGWRLHTSIGVNPRSVRNFPAQAHGAEMLRLACCLCTERGILVCAPIHDALMVEANLEDIVAVVEQTQAAMQEASELVLPDFPLRTEAKIVRYPERYVDPRGVRMWKTVRTILEEATCDVPF
jgi:DNA polymerase family A